jgi:hypothetical protein
VYYHSILSPFQSQHLPPHCVSPPRCNRDISDVRLSTACEGLSIPFSSEGFGDPITGDVKGVRTVPGWYAIARADDDLLTSWVDLSALLGDQDLLRGLMSLSPDLMPP